MISSLFTKPKDGKFAEVILGDPAAAELPAGAGRTAIAQLLPLPAVLLRIVFDYDGLGFQDAEPCTGEESAEMVKAWAREIGAAPEGCAPAVALAVNRRFDQIPRVQDWKAAAAFMVDVPFEGMFADANNASALAKAYWNNLGGRRLNIAQIFVLMGAAREIAGLPHDDGHTLARAALENPSILVASVRDTRSMVHGMFQRQLEALATIAYSLGRGAGPREVGDTALALGGLIAELALQREYEGIAALLVGLLRSGVHKDMLQQLLGAFSKRPGVAPDKQKGFFGDPPLTLESLMRKLGKAYRRPEATFWAQQLSLSIPPAPRVRKQK